MTGKYRPGDEDSCSIKPDFVFRDLIEMADQIHRHKAADGEFYCHFDFVCNIDVKISKKYFVKVCWVIPDHS